MNKHFCTGTILLSIISLSFFSCDKKIGKNLLILPSNTLAVSECDTITYSKHIKPIINLYCGSAADGGVGCHAGGVPSGSVDLDTYNELMIQVNSGQLKKTVFSSEPKQMPPEDKDQLTDAQKKLINCWLNNGNKN